MNIVEDGYEGQYFAFKAKNYADKGDFLIDIISITNSMGNKNKFTNIVRLRLFELSKQK